MSSKELLGNVCEFRNSQRRPVTGSERQPGPYPYYGAASIQDWVHDFLFDGLHLLVGEDGTVQTPDGRPMIQLVDGKFWVNNHAHVLRCESDMDTRFLAYSLREVSIAPFVTGAAQPKVNMGNLKRIQIDWPEKRTRKSVAEIGKCIDDRISLLRETNETLIAIAQALFKSWFVDFDPVRDKMEGRAPEDMDEATVELFPDGFEESELGLVPRGWRNVSLREAVSIHDSKRIPLSGQERDKRKGPYPYYGAAALMDAVDDYIFDGVYLLTGEDGSVADTNGYPIMQYVWGKFWVNNHAHILQGKDGVSTEHVMLALQRMNITPYITGAVQAKLSQTNMWRINFLMPPLEIAIHFGSLLEPLFVRFRENAELANTLAALRDTLLPRLISGQMKFVHISGD
jgi:restriction endonuclease S subunit